MYDLLMHAQVKYREGQRYVRHHDNNEQYFKMPMGPRVLTFFLYLDPRSVIACRGAWHTP